MREKKNGFNPLGWRHFAEENKNPERFKQKKKSVLQRKKIKAQGKAKGKLGLERNRKRASWELKKKKL